MNESDKLTEVYQSAKEIPFDFTDKFIFFSDCHRGDNSWADDFAHNQNMLFYALEHYLKEGFTYIEVGDGDELWENSDFGEIRRAHSHIFWLLQQFYQAGRLHLMWGNHDLERADPARVRDTLYTYHDERSGQTLPLFDGIQLNEGIILRNTSNDHSLFLAHGHQVDPINYKWWKVNRFIVRYYWRNVQVLGVRDPTSPAENEKKRNKVEQRLVDWAQSHRQITIAGHTHRPRFPKKDEPPYFNIGSCVHPRCITGIEVQNGEIILVKWSVEPDENAHLYVVREVIDHESIQAYYR